MSDTDIDKSGSDKLKPGENGSRSRKRHVPKSPKRQYSDDSSLHPDKTPE